MIGAVLYGPGDVRFEERDAPTFITPTDAIIAAAHLLQGFQLRGRTRHPEED